MSIRVAILGYGNLGRGMECAVKQNDDMELVAVFTRRDPATVKTLTDVKVYNVDQLLSMQDQITLLAEQSKKKVVEPTFNEVIGGAIASQLAPVLTKIEEMQRVSLRLSKIIP